MAKYICDLIAGILIGFLPCCLSSFYVGMNPYPNIKLMLFLLGGIVPLILLFFYSVIRYKVTQQQPSTALNLLGNFLGFSFEFGIATVLSYYFPEMLDIYYGGDEFYGIICGMLLKCIIAPVSIVFLQLFFRKKRKKMDEKMIWWVAAQGYAYCYPILLYMVFQLRLDIIIANQYRTPKIIIASWVELIAICLLESVTILLVGKGKNIPHMITVYIVEAVILLICIRVFSAPLEEVIIIGTGIVVILGAGICKGLEKLYKELKKILTKKQKNINE